MADASFGATYATEKIIYYLHQAPNFWAGVLGFIKAIFFFGQDSSFTTCYFISEPEGNPHSW